MQRIGGSFCLAFIAAIPALACSRGEPRSALADSAPVENVAAAQDSGSAVAGFRFVLSPTGSAARYRVRERLVGHNLPNDAIGETKSPTARSISTLTER